MILRVVYALFLGFVFYNHFRSYPIPEFLSKLTAFAEAVFLTFSFIPLGRIFAWLIKSTVRICGVQTREDYTGTSVFWGLGFGAFGLMMLISGWILPGTLKLKTLLLTSFLAALLLREIFISRKPFPTLSLFHGELTVWKAATLIIFLGGLALAFLACFSPITYYDSLVYHLALPALYSAKGKIELVDFNLYAFFPANVEMVFLYIIDRFIEPEYVINLLGVFTSLLLSLGIFQWLGQILKNEKSYLPLALWWSMPTALFLSIGGYIEIFLAFFTFMSVRSFHQSYQHDWDPVPLIISGLFSGFAMATKYTGALCPIILCVWILAVGIVRKKVPLTAMFLFAGMAFLPLSPWLVKNFVFCGNPVFPFLYNWLGGDVGWTKTTAENYFRLLTEYGMKGNLLYDLFLIPWNLSADPRKYGGGFDVLGLFGWPIVFFSFPLAFVFGRKERPIQFLTYYFLAHTILWYLTKPVLRFLVGALPVGMVLTSYVIAKILRENPKKYGLLISLLLIPWLASNFFIYMNVTDQLDVYSVSLGKETADQFLHRKLTFYSTYDYANQTLSSNDKILLLGEQRTYHLRIPFVCPNIFSVNPIADWFNEAKGTSSLKESLRLKGITHLLINQKELQRLGGMGSFGFSEEGSWHFNQLIDNECLLLKNKRDVVLYSLI